MANIELVNKSEYPTDEFVDISTEEWREYTWFPGSDRVSTKRIENPQWILSTPSGHRVVDGEGRCWYIPATWHSLCWEPKSGKPHFVK